MLTKLTDYGAFCGDNERLRQTGLIEACQHRLETIGYISAFFALFGVLR